MKTKPHPLSMLRVEVLESAATQRTMAEQTQRTDQMAARLHRDRAEELEGYAVALETAIKSAKAAAPKVTPKKTKVA